MDTTTGKSDRNDADCLPKAGLSDILNILPADQNAALAILQAILGER